MKNIEFLLEREILVKYLGDAAIIENKSISQLRTKH